jgi:hypothetical protein
MNLAVTTAGAIAWKRRGINVWSLVPAIDKQIFQE